MTTKTDDPRYLRALRWTLVVAIWSFARLVYRAFLNVEIQPNEGWNAYFADAAVPPGYVLVGLLKLVSKAAEMLNSTSVNPFGHARGRYLSETGAF